MELRPPGRWHKTSGPLKLKHIKINAKPGTELHAVPFNSLWSSIIIQIRLIIDKILNFLQELGTRLRHSRCQLDYLSYTFLIQHLSVAVQQGNPASVLGTAGA